MTRYLLVRLVLGLGIGFLGAFVTIEAIDRYGSDDGLDPSANEVLLGPADIAGFCAELGPTFRPQLQATDADGWRCAGPVDGLMVRRPIDFDEVCRWQHGDTARSRLEDPDDVGGWHCVAPG